MEFIDDAEEAAPEGAPAAAAEGDGEEEEDDVSLAGTSPGNSHDDLESIAEEPVFETPITKKRVVISAKRPAVKRKKGNMPKKTKKAVSKKSKGGKKKAGKRGGGGISQSKLAKLAKVLNSL